MRERFAWVLLILSAPLGSLQGLAHAQEDAGTQSAFAFGAGPRALGMGSAFIAAADDASAVVWNPAGLAAVDRLGFHAAQSSDLGLDVRETFAVLVLPSWRWGTTALSVRTHGVAGVDGRDASNVQTGAFTDGQLEVALGYGRAWSRGFRVGGAAKLQRHSQAGVTANGLGLDLGVQLDPAAALPHVPSWAHGWTVGMAARNALRPTLRLDRDAVTDPTVLRTGLAWRGPTAGLGQLLAEIDVEKAQGVSARLHSGLEYRPTRGWALRIGHDGSVVSAGSSFQFRELALDYAFVDNPIASEHRVGASIAFGPSTTQRREAAQRRQDEALESRLAEIVAERQIRQIAELQSRAEASRARGDLDDALEALEAAQILEPGRSDVAAAIAACLVERAAALERAGDWLTAALTYEQAIVRAPQDSVARAGAARSRAESDRRTARSSRARDHFRAAMDAFVADDLRRARDGFGAALRETPEDPEAVAMLARTDRAIARRCTEWIQNAQRSLRAGQIAEARGLLQRAADLNPDASGLAAARAALARAKPPAATAPPAASARAPEGGRGRLDDRELDRLYRRGLAAYERHQLEDAQRYWELVWSSRPGYREVNDLLKREYLTRGIEAFGAGRLEEAISQWRKALRIDPEDERARGYLARAQEQMGRIHEIVDQDR